MNHGNTDKKGSLGRSTCSAQAELVSEGIVSARPLYSSEDGQWSDGLISAARTVAAACHNLCEAANSLVQGHATEEKLISSAKQVASSTAQLLVACRVKTGSNSTSMQRLQAAGNAVMRATDALVRAAQQSLDAYEERSLVINRRIVGGIAQEISAQVRPIYRFSLRKDPNQNGKGNEFETNFSLKHFWLKPKVCGEKKIFNVVIFKEIHFFF